MRNNLTEEMIRVADDWHDGGKSIMYLVGIKRLAPSNTRKLVMLMSECNKALSELLPNMDYTERDSRALHELHNWARAKVRRMKFTAELKAAVNGLLDNGGASTAIEGLVRTLIQKREIIPE